MAFSFLTSRSGKRQVMFRSSISKVFPNLHESVLAFASAGQFLITQTLKGRSVWGSLVLISVVKRVSSLVIIIIVPLQDWNVIWFHMKCFWSSSPKWFHINSIVQQYIYIMVLLFWENVLVDHGVIQNIIWWHCSYLIACWWPIQVLTYNRSQW